MNTQIISMMEMSGLTGDTEPLTLLKEYDEKNFSVNDSVVASKASTSRKPVTRRLGYLRTV